MRTLFILRGAPASGKSTWVQENCLEEYTLSSDMVRLLYQGPITNSDGTQSISQNHDKEVWELLLNLLERRMENGEFIIIDATHYKAPLINKYKDLIDKYRYRVKVVDFSNISEEELLERNSKRSTYKQVPEETIKKMVVALKDSSEVKKAYDIISPEEAAELIKSPLQPISLDEYEKIIVFGDIHGCYDPLDKYFKENPFNEKYFYIFCGDYIDRGLQNKETLEFLLSIYKNKNVQLLEGNHEKWLRIYSQKDYNPIDYNKEYKYNDLCKRKVVAQVKEAINKFEAKVKNNNKEIETLKELQGEQKKEIVYYLFEEVNVPDRLTILNKANKQYTNIIKEFETYLIKLEHDSEHVKKIIELLDFSYLAYTDKEMSYNITRLLEKEYPVKALNKENPIKSREFLDNTLPQIKDIDKAELRQLCRKFIQMSYFTFRGQNYLVTHAGVPNMPCLRTPSNDFIKGVGKYEESNDVEKCFIENTYGNIIQIHGHRNVFKETTLRYIKSESGFINAVINLNTEIEFGEPLRILEISNGLGGLEIPNTIYQEKEEIKVEEKTDIEILKDMIKSPLVQVKELDKDVISLNFTREAFEKGRWNSLTCKARGLFVNKMNGDVVGRSFSKFFNYGQVDETTAPALKQTFAYPIIGYKKENGFLGIVSKYKGQIYFFTKSSDGGDYVNWFIGALCDNYNLSRNYYTYNRNYEKDNILYCEQLRNQLENVLSPNILEGYSYVFECIDTLNDPHIIKYHTDKIVLLEVFKNQLKEEHIPYKKLLKVGKLLNIPVKEKELEFNTWEEFEEWKNKFRHDKTQWDCRHEGYVLEDANGFRVKFKSSFYNFWKQMRGLKQTLQKGSGNKKIYKTKEEIEVSKLMSSIPKEELEQMSIIDIEDMYYNS